MARRGQRDLAKERFWRRMLQRWQRCRLSIRDFCAQQHLSEPSFYGWRRTLAQRDPKATTTAAARQRPAAAPPAPRPTFVPVQVVSVPSPALELVLRNGRLLRVPPGFDAATLRQLLALVEEPSC